MAATKLSCVTLQPPTAASEIGVIQADTGASLSISKIYAVLRGSASPSVTWTLRHDGDRSLTGTEVVTGGTTTTTTTTAQTISSFNNPTIGLEDFLWLEITAVSGTVDELSITIYF